MEPGGKSREVRAGMTIIFTHPCSRYIRSTSRSTTSMEGSSPSSWGRVPSTSHAHSHILHSQGPAKSHQTATRTALETPWKKLTPTGQELAWRALENGSSDTGNHESMLYKDAWGRKAGSRHSRSRGSRSEPRSSAHLLRVRFCPDCECQPEPSPHG